MLHAAKILLSVALLTLSSGIALANPQDKVNCPSVDALQTVLKDAKIDVYSGGKQGYYSVQLTHSFQFENRDWYLSTPIKAKNLNEAKKKGKKNLRNILTQYNTEAEKVVNAYLCHYQGKDEKIQATSPIK